MNKQSVKLENRERRFTGRPFKNVVNAFCRN